MYKRKKLTIGILAVVLALTLAGCAGAPAPTAGATEAGPLVAVRASTAVIAEGRVLPLQSAQLALTTGGRVVALGVQEGDAVQGGQTLVRLDDRAQAAALAQAEAALAAAQADLARVQAPVKPEQIAAAEAAVASAQASIEVARSQAESARSALALYDGQVAQAQAALRDLRAGATAEEREIARLQIDLAKNQLWGAQAVRDGVAGAVSRGQARDYDKDQAEAAVLAAEVSQQIAQQRQAQVEAGARPGAVAQTLAALSIAEAQRVQGQATVTTAETQVGAAEAGLVQAQAQLALVKAAATQPEVQRAEAAVAQAEAALEAARVALDNTVLSAPRDGTVTWLGVKVGEQVAPLTPVVTLATVGEWRIETQDLTEIEVVRVTVGQKVTVTPDALPDVGLAGTVVAIRDQFEERRGDVTYAVTVRLDESDPRLRWGMTAVVTFAE
jgi:multidrug resistance efflux pump